MVRQAGIDRLLALSSLPLACRLLPWLPVRSPADRSLPEAPPELRAHARALRVRFPLSTKCTRSRPTGRLLALGAPGGNRPPARAFFLPLACRLLPWLPVRSPADRSLPEAPPELRAHARALRVRFPLSTKCTRSRPTGRLLALGAPGGNRTRGLHIRSVLLYPLSYWRAI